MAVVVTVEEMEGNLRKLLDAVRDGKQIVVTAEYTNYASQPLASEK